MKTWHLYDKHTGLFTGRAFQGLENALKGNVPEGFGARSDVDDWQSQKVDFASGEIIDHQPQAPDSFHEWNAETKRWQLTAEREQQIAEDAAARRQLEELDRKAVRAIIEDRLGMKPSVSDKDAGAMTIAEIQAAQAKWRLKLLK